MIVLEELKLLQKIMGLNPQGALENTVVRLIYLIIFSLSLFMYTTYFILNIHGNISVTSAHWVQFSAAQCITRIICICWSAANAFSHSWMIYKLSWMKVRNRVCNPPKVNTEFPSFLSDFWRRSEKCGRRSDIHKGWATDLYCSEDRHLCTTGHSCFIFVSVRASSD